MTTVFLKETELAKKLKLSAGTLRNWRSQGVGPSYYKLRGRVVYKEADLIAWIDKRKIVKEDSEC